MPENLYVIVGLGITGLSCARYLAKKKIPFAVYDTREHPPHLAEFKQAFPEIPVALGLTNSHLLTRASTLVVSPGVSIHEPFIAAQIARSIPVIGDIELFAEQTKAPVIAITGTNAKSTVTTLVGEMAKTANYPVQVGGNLGLPALDLLEAETQTPLFVLELSSFQLETTHSLAPKVATILNITPDHMDRYATLEDYAKAKHRIYAHADIAVCNRDDALTEANHHAAKLYFTLNKPRKNEFGLLEKNNELYLTFEDQPLLPYLELPIKGRHYAANALAALALGYGFGFSMDSMRETLMNFKGLPHRCQFVREYLGVFWYNDSKGTNVGATIAAILGMGPAVPGKLILIAGGIGKNADFTPLIPPIKQFVKTVILMGADAPILAEVLGDQVPLEHVKSMEEAVQVAKRIASPGDGVLLSPACASFDMFKNFEHRGQVFTENVQAL